MNWVLIRGIVSEKYHWGDFVSLMKSRFPQHQLQTADILGNGDSRHQLTPLSVTRNVQGLRNQVATSGPKILFGFSLGGMLALEWAYRHRDEVAGVVLINSSLGGSPAAKRLLPGAIKNIASAALKKNFIEKETLILKMTTHQLAEERIKILAHDWGNHGLKNPIRPVNFFLQLGVASQIKLKKTPPDIPLLILSSAKDQVVHPDCSKTIAQTWSLDHHVHPSAGHDLTLEDPKWVLDHTESWIKRWPTIEKSIDPSAGLNLE